MSCLFSKIERVLCAGAVVLLGVTSVAAGPLPDLAISSGNCVATNMDLAISKAFPKKNQPVQVTVSVRNIGAAPSGSSTLKIADGLGFSARKAVPRIDAHGSTSVSFQYKPSALGLVALSFTLDSANTVKESNESNNSATVQIPVVAKDTYILWYGDVPDLKYVNIAQTRDYGIAEWKRRGAYAATYAEPIRETTEQLVEYHSELLNRGYDTLAIDELGCAEANKNQFWTEGFRQIKQSYPNCFIAAWYVGRLDAQMARLVKAGTVDLLVFEAYVKPDDPKWAQRLQFYIDQARTAGVLDRAIIGLGTDKAYSGALSAGEHAAFVEQQITYIRTNAPEMPGVGFFTALTLPGERELIDELCRKHFFSDGK